MIKIQKGFTLIELLVVIAIIGILAGILFVAIDPAAQTTKANDSKTKAQFAAIASRVSTTFFDSNSNGYQDVETDPRVIELLAGLVNSSVESEISGWAIKAQLSNNNYYCRDSSGAISEKTIQDITDFKCD